MEQLSFDKAKEKAFKLLEFRSHSKKELTEKLKRAGASDEDTEKIIRLFCEYKLLDDAAYALRKARDLKNLKKYGKRRIEQELYYKGIKSEDIASAIAEFDFEDTEDTLYPLVKRKLAGDFEKKSLDRCIRYFIYRGYELRDIKGCIERIKGEADEF